jgi:predicted regulator of Ras-like GTPase activity (Roadblock/LC7/MglB family)
METILQAVLDVTGVGAALVFDGGGHLVCHRGHAIYDRALCEQLSSTLGKAVDTIQLQQEDWESISARYEDGKLLLRNLGAAGGGTHVLAVVADATLNLSFATVAIRVAANKLKKALRSGAASSVLAAAPSQSAASSATLLTGSSVQFVGSSALLASSRLADSRPALAGSSGLSWSQTSSVGLSRIAVADPASSTFLSRAAKELARHVGPMAKVYVEEAVRRVSPDAPFSVSLAAKLLDDLAGQIDDNGDRTRFRQALALAGQIPPADHPRWIALVTGKVQFKPSFLAARMFLASARLEVGKSGANPELIRKYAAGLRDMFAENADSPSVRQDLAKVFK